MNENISGSNVPVPKVKNFSDYLSDSVNNWEENHTNAVKYVKSKFHDETSKYIGNLAGNLAAKKLKKFSYNNAVSVFNNQKIGTSGRATNIIQAAHVANDTFINNNIIIGRASKMVKISVSSGVGTIITTGFDLATNDHSTPKNRSKIGSDIAISFVGGVATGILFTTFAIPALPSIFIGFAVTAGVSLANDYLRNRIPILNNFENKLGGLVINGYHSVKRSVIGISKNVVAGSKAFYHGTRKVVHRIGKAVNSNIRADVKWAKKTAKSVISWKHKIGRKVHKSYTRSRFGKSVKGFHNKLHHYLGGIGSGAKIKVETFVAGKVAGLLNSASSELSAIKRANDEILPEMQVALNQVANEFNSIFPVDMSGDIEEVINANGLKPRQYADVSAIKAVDNEVNKHKKNIHTLISGVNHTVRDQQSTDSEWSGKFHL